MRDKKAQRRTERMPDKASGAVFLADVPYVWPVNLPVPQNTYGIAEWFLYPSGNLRYRIFHWVSEDCRYPVRIPLSHISNRVPFQTRRRSECCRPRVLE